jgi:tripartite motif-containing protein 71
LARLRSVGQAGIKFSFLWGTQGDEDGQFVFPTGVAIDSNDKVYVTDQNNGRIQKFTSDGVFLAKSGPDGNKVSEFSEPEGVDVDSNGRVYVADTGNSRVQSFDLSNTKRQLATPS